MENRILACSIFDAIERGAPYSELKIAVSELLKTTSLEKAGEFLPNVQKHPLGFLAYRWSLGNGCVLRVHVWDKNFDWIQKPTWQVHDHVFGFNSVVLTGKIQNKCYRITLDSRGKRQWCLYQVTYEACQSQMEEYRNGVSLGMVCTCLQTTGSRYSLPPFEFHRSILRSEFAVTVLSTRQNDRCFSKPLVVGDGVSKNLLFDRDSIAASQVEIITRMVINRLMA